MTTLQQEQEKQTLNSQGFISQKNRLSKDGIREEHIQGLEQARGEILNSKHVFAMILIFLFVIWLLVGQIPTEQSLIHQNLDSRYQQQLVDSLSYQPFTLNSEEWLTQCPSHADKIFHVFIKDAAFKRSQKEKQMQIISTKLAQKCQIRILTVKDLEAYAEKWNGIFKKQIVVSDYLSFEQEELLKFLHLFFSGGLYLSLNGGYESLNEKCWRAVSFDETEILFTEFKEETESGILIPSSQNFVYVRAKQMLRVAKAIQRLIDRGEPLNQCVTEQCLLVQCWGSPSQ